MEITKDKGILLSKGEDNIVLDPHKKRERAIVSHGHMDHLVSGALMTPETRDIMEARTGAKEATLMRSGDHRDWHGFDVKFHSAGHVLGSIMAEVEGVLYTGDFNPEGGFLSPPPPTPDIDVLITEATYGSPKFSFPPKTRVLEDMMSWVEAMSPEGPVVVGAYEFGKAQEIMNMGRRLDLEIWVPEKVAKITDVYNKHNAKLDYKVLDGVTPQDPGTLVVVPPSWLKPPKKDPIKQEYEMIKDIRNKGGASAFASGWCTLYKYFRSMLIDAQFPLSDHADHEHLLGFIEDTGAKEVLIVHAGKDGKGFAEEVEQKVGCKARVL